MSPSVGTFRPEISEHHCRITTSQDHSTYTDDEDIEENIDEISADDKENEDSAVQYGRKQPVINEWLLTDREFINYEAVEEYVKKEAKKSFRQTFRSDQKIPEVVDEKGRQMCFSYTYRCTSHIDCSKRVYNYTYLFYAVYYLLLL